MPADRAGPAGLQCFEVEPVGRRARREALDDDLALCGEFGDRFAAGVAVGIEQDGALVGLQVGGGDALAVRAEGGELPQRARWWLDEHDFRAEVGEQAGAPRAGRARRDVENANAFECACHSNYLPPVR